MQLKYYNTSLTNSHCLIIWSAKHNVQLAQDKVPVQLPNAHPGLSNTNYLPLRARWCLSVRKVAIAPLSTCKLRDIKYNSTWYCFFGIRKHFVRAVGGISGFVNSRQVIHSTLNHFTSITSLKLIIPGVPFTAYTN